MEEFFKGLFKAYKKDITEEKYTELDIRLYGFIGLSIIPIDYLIFPNNSLFLALTNFYYNIGEFIYNLIF